MSRSTVRLLAVIVLALLGAPLAMHVVLHDLHAHENEHADEAYATDHSDHDHPIVPAAAPELPDVTWVQLPGALVPTDTATVFACVATGERNVLSSGALRMDDDVGVQPLLSTFLI